MPFPQTVATTAATAATAATATASVVLTLRCNVSADVVIGVATERDAGRQLYGDAAAAGGAAAAIDLAQQHVAAAASAIGRFALGQATDEWWAQWWDLSDVRLGAGLEDLERWYFTMSYLQRGSTRTGAVAPALWGPWSVSDGPAIYRIDGFCMIAVGTLRTDLMRSPVIYLFDGHPLTDVCRPRPRSLLAVKCGVSTEADRIV